MQPPEVPESSGAASASPPSALGDLLARIATSLRGPLPLDRAVLLLLGESDGLRSLASEGDGSAPPDEKAGLRSDYSPALWHEDAATPWVVADAESELDRDYPGDRELLAQGAASVLVVPILRGPLAVGRLLLTCRLRGGLEAGHLQWIEPLVELLAVAVEHERLWSLERARQQRRDKLEALLPTLAQALDVRQVFLGMSAVIQEVIPHDMLAFALLAPDRGGVRVQAATDAGLREMPEYRFSNPEEALDAEWKFLLAHDLVLLEDGRLRVRRARGDETEPPDVVLEPGSAWAEFVRASRVRSTLRVPILADGRPIGGVAFLSRSPNAYGEEDGALASRIADHVALALAHQRLAEEERRRIREQERTAQLQTRIDVLSCELEQLSPHRALGQSPAWKRVLAEATQVAPTETTVLITGESGTGKEVVARFIHRGSPRASGPFVALNCAALPESLLESELFGHERGAFTGALSARPGKIEQAAGGVLFLDEVAEMAPAIQAKFLRVLQERELQRVGGTRTLRADVRILAATNRELERAMQAGALREDLYYRLAVFAIHLPPLRERPEDIQLLADGFLRELAKSVGRPATGFSDDARAKLRAHAWPGNVRELRNAVERAVVLCGGGVIGPEHLPAPQGRTTAPVPATAAEFPAEGVSLGAVERELLVAALARTHNNKSHTARLLGLSRGQLYSLLRRHGLTEARR